MCSRDEISKKFLLVIITEQAIHVSKSVNSVTTQNSWFGHSQYEKEIQVDFLRCAKQNAQSVRFRHVHANKCVRQKTQHVAIYDADILDTTQHTWHTQPEHSEQVVNHVTCASDTQSGTLTFWNHATAVSDILVLIGNDKDYGTRMALAMRDDHDPDDEPLRGITWDLHT